MNQTKLLEAVEARLMLAATVTLSPDGALNIDSSKEVAIITVEPSGSDYKVIANNKTSLYAKNEVHSLFIIGSKYDDIITVDSGVNVPTTISGSGGFDVIQSGYSETVIQTEYDGHIYPVSGNTIQYIWTGAGSHPQVQINLDSDEDQGQISYAFELYAMTKAGLVPTGDISGGGLGNVIQGLRFSFSPLAENIAIGTGGAAEIFDCGGGDDVVTTTGGSQFAHNVSTILGGNGNDSIASTFPNHFYLSGGKGDDTLSSANTVSDTLEGGPGTDTADYSSRTAPLNITLDNNPNDGESGEQDNVMSDVENILGGSGNDRLIGDSAANYIAGNQGNDYIHGGDGNDTLAGGGGKDHLYGEAGDDLLEARRGSKDFLDGGDGSDSASYDAGIDSVLNVEKFLP